MCNSFRQLSLYGWRGKKQHRAGCSAHSLSHWRVPSPTSPSLLALRSSPGSREIIYQVDTEAHGKEKNFQDGSRVADLADCKQNAYHSWTQWNFSSFFYKPSEIANSLPGIMPGGYWTVIINHINIILKGFISLCMLCAPGEWAWVIVVFLNSVLKTRCTDALVSSWCLERTSFVLLCEHQGDRMWLNYNRCHSSQGHCWYLLLFSCVHYRVGVGGPSVLFLLVNE